MNYWEGLTSKCSLGIIQKLWVSLGEGRFKLSTSYGFNIPQVVSDLFVRRVMEKKAK